ncbi:MAG: hypothetical protein MI922_17165 [Bacteroidales bacterium]|nr:hypothetical protein [Bacteroidales bacterium]
MSLTLSTKYYLQALEAYPYDLAETMESLDYALSYDSKHAGVHCLMGQLYMEQTKQFDKAEHHFEQALICDINHLVTYELYSLLLIELGEFKRAKKLVKHAYTLKGASVCKLKHREALILERKGKYTRSREILTEAYDLGFNNSDREFLKNELDRLKEKVKANKKRKSR